MKPEEEKKLQEIEEMFSKEKGWNEIEDKTGCWKPKGIGDYITGIYTGIKTNVGKHHSEVYLIKSGEIEYKVFETEQLKQKMEDVPIGYEVVLIYKGSKKSPAPKSPFKMFDVKKREPSEENLSPEAEIAADKKDSPTLADADDPATINTIEIYEDIYKSEHFDKKPTCDEIIQLAETDPDLSKEDVTKIKVQLAKDKKAGKRI
jgi:hypothetical protein